MLPTNFITIKSFVNLLDSLSAQRVNVYLKHVNSRTFPFVRTIPTEPMCVILPRPGNGSYVSHLWLGLWVGGFCIAGNQMSPRLW